MRFGAKVFACMVVAAAVSGCQSTTSATSAQVPAPETPEDLYQFAFSTSMARQIAKRCRSIRFWEYGYYEQVQVLTLDLDARGYDASDIDAMTERLPKKRLQSDAFDFIRESGIVLGDRATYCTAGYREIQNKTQIGRYLIKRK